MAAFAFVRSKVGLKRLLLICDEANCYARFYASIVNGDMLCVDSLYSIARHTFSENSQT
jgi:hypothetical protein